MLFPSAGTNQKNCMEIQAMSRFNIEYAGTVRGEAARAMLARMVNHDGRDGLGGYYLTKADMERLRKVLGDNTDSALKDAGFRPRPGKRWQWWTGSRAPGGDDARIRFEPPWELLRVIVCQFGELDTAS